MHIDRIQSRSTRYAATVLLPLALVLAFTSWGSSGASEAEPSSAATAKPPEMSSAAQVVVTYFHTTFRCPTCRKLEEYSRETVENDFAKQIEEKKIVFRAVDVEEPENQHFVQEYGLYTKSLILSLTKDGKEIRWKNLPDIWRLVQDRAKFEQYVQSEIEAYLKDL
ncbi:MAG: nitrophenyl compound nitroreductase subunit ArsF family protein [bacterium]